MGARRHSAALAFVLALAPALAAAEAPAQQGLDPQRICAIGPALETLKRADPEGVVVVRHGALVYEHYFGAGSTARAAGSTTSTPRCFPCSPNTPPCARRARSASRCAIC